MAIISFGEYKDGRKYKTLDERGVRASAGIMFLLALVAFVNAFFLQRFHVIPFIAGFLALNFAIGIFINPKFSPTVIIATYITRNQSELPIGAIQKKFAWGLGLTLSVSILILSILLQSDPFFFKSVCALCILCLFLLFAETAFGICVGCELYHSFLKMKWIKEPEEKPNCMGDSCKID